MHRDQAPCLACSTAVPSGARSCPACGYSLDSHDYRRLWLGGLGTALTLTVVLAPLGLPLLWRANRHRQAAAGSVTKRAERTLGQHLRTVALGFLSLDRTRAGSTELQRASSRAGSQASELGQR
jgi:hypothetical protein